MPTSKRSANSVAVFWDYENCPAPSNASGYSIANNICKLARPYGVVKLFKAYFEISDQFRSIALRSELQSSGVSLVDCPHNGRKEVADKMLLVDMLTYAIDNPAPSTIILITGDRDFAYALSILKHRQYQVVLVTLANAHPSLVQACVCFDWFDDIINQLDINPQHRNNAQQEVSHETQPSSHSLANDVTETDYQYPRKQVPTEAFLAYPTRNARAPPLPFTKNSGNGTAQINHGNSPVSSRVRSREPEDPTAMDASRKTDTVLRFPTNGNCRENERNGLVASSNKSLIARIGLANSPSSSGRSSPLASPGRENDRESEQSGPMAIPSIYLFLVKILQGHRRKGITHSYRSVIASKMAHEQPTYRKAGVNTFAEFMYLAEQNGVIELGGSGKDSWIRLMPDWYHAVPY